MAPQFSPALLALFSHATGDALGAFAWTAVVGVAVGLILGGLLHVTADGDGRSPAAGLQDAAAALGSTALLVLTAAVLPCLRWRGAGAVGQVAAHVAPLALVAAGLTARWVDQALRAAAADHAPAPSNDAGGVAARLLRLPLRAAAPRIAAGVALTVIALAAYASVAVAVGSGAGEHGVASAAHGLPDALLGVVLLLIALAQAVRAAGDGAVAAAGDRRMLQKA